MLPTETTSVSMIHAASSSMLPKDRGASFAVVSMIALITEDEGYRRLCDNLLSPPQKKKQSRQEAIEDVSADE